MTHPVQEMSLARSSRDGLGFEFSVSLIGAIARRSVERIGYGYVIAVFDGSFYVETIGGIVCVARDDLGASPLNILVDVPRTVSWVAAGIRVGARVRFSRHVSMSRGASRLRRLVTIYGRHLIFINLFLTVACLMVFAN